MVVWSDNSGVVHPSNRGPRSAKGREMVKALSKICLDLRIEVRARHIPGVKNVEADRLSRDTVPAFHLRNRSVSKCTFAVTFRSHVSMQPMERLSLCMIRLGVCARV